MEESPLLKIYADTERLILYKRTLFKNIVLQIPSSPIQQNPKTSSSKIYICLHKLVSELQNYFSALAKHQKFEFHLSDISMITGKLKNNRDLVGKQQLCFARIEELIKRWEQTKDPLLYYSIRERQQLQSRINEQIKGLEQWYSTNQQIKKPFYIRKMERELRQNLINFSKQQIHFNNYQYSFYRHLQLKITRLVTKIIHLIGNMPKEELINQQKMEILKKYIDVFSSSSFQNQKQVHQYNSDLIRAYKNMIIILQIEKQNFQLLLQYLSLLQSAVQSTEKKFKKVEDQFSQEVKGVPDEIFAIVAFQDILPIINSAKSFFQFHKDLKALRDKIKQKSNYLDQSLDLLHDSIKKTGLRPLLIKVSAIQQFLADKKIMELLAKKQRAFEDFLLDSLCFFFKKYQKSLSQNNERNLKIPECQAFQISKSLEHLFINYFEKTQSPDKQQDEIQSKAVSSINIRQRNFNKMRKIYDFLRNLKVFNQNVDLSDSFNCSLGPKLLINGQLKALPIGLYFESIFNKKNIFFGNTKIFIPKEQIFQINKQRYLFLPISTQLITKGGLIFFNSMNKQEAIYNQLISFYLPEAGINNAQELCFNLFKGNKDELTFKIQQFLAHYPNFICSGTISNVPLATLFHRYFSSEEVVIKIIQFSYQGKKYKHFKQFSCELAGGTDIKSTGFTPGIPYYFQLTTSQESNKRIDNQSIEQSSRLLTYKKSIPYIPFLSQGGMGICSQKNIYRWGGPKCFVIDIITIVSGFPLLEGMKVKIRQIFQEKQNDVLYHMSSDIQFQISKATNSLLRSPTLSETKEFIGQIVQKLTKIERNRNVKKGNQQKRGQSLGGVLGVRLAENIDNLEGATNSQELISLNAQLKKWKGLMKCGAIVFAIIYVITLYIALQ